MVDGPKRYLGMVQLKDTQRRRLLEDVPKVVALFDRFSRGEREVAFRSVDGLLFGFLFRSSLPPGVMHHEFEQCDGTQNGDGVMIFEAGELGVGNGGFTRASAWLQRH